MSARSFLFVPGDREDMLAKAAGRGADALIVDLEDAVAVASKGKARAFVRDWLRDGVPELPGGVWVRVNNHPDLLGHDLAVLTGSGIAGIFVPKVEAAEQLAAIAALATDQGWGVVAMIESARGVLSSEQIAASGFADRLAIGEVDLAADLGMGPGLGEAESLSVRMHLVIVSAAAALPSPIGPVYTAFRDVEGLRHSTKVLRRLGLWSRPAIHPGQVSVINEVFSPSSSEVDAARRLVDLFEEAEAEGRGVCVDELGWMIDEAVVRSARSILAAAGVALI